LALRTSEEAERGLTGVYTAVGGYNQLYIVHVSLSIFVKEVSEKIDEIPALEYAALRDELATNKQYIFERPLLIVASIGIAFIQIKDVTHLALLPFLLVVTLWTNLALTTNRMWSSSRIAAYIGIVLENLDKGKWKGWENSLREYRIVINNPSDFQKEEIRQNHDSFAIPESMVFYRPILRFHIIFIVIAVLLSFVYFFQNFNLSKYPTGLNLVSLLNFLEIQSLESKWILLCSISTIVAALGFARSCITNYSISKMNNHIEEQRAIWSSIFQQNLGNKNDSPHSMDSKDT
jgi:hypothetical protein